MSARREEISSHGGGENGRMNRARTRKIPPEENFDGHEQPEP